MIPTHKTMTEKCTPYEKEKELLVKITKREAVLIEKLRKYPFGRFLIHKMDNILVRIEITDSQLIEEDTPVSIDKG